MPVIGSTTSAGPSIEKAILPSTMPVNDVPRPRSLPQILGNIVNSLTSRIGIRRLRTGGAILSVIEAASQSDVKNSQDTFQLLQAKDLDNSRGQALDREGASDGVDRFRVAKATGYVTFTDTSFDKIASKLFQGAAAPIVGSVAIQVEDASDFPSSGSVYLGRLTPNLEGPIAYTSKVDNGAYWTLNLSTATTRFHNRGESTILSQGGIRLVDAGTLVATAQGALVSAVQFSTVFQAQIPDGETTVEDVLVLANVAGAAGNVEAGAVTELPGGAPFPGADVSNPLPFVTGRDTELDDPYRERIRAVRASKQRATDSAIINAVLGIVAADESRRCTSAALVRRRGMPSILYIDDGSGYEEATSGVGIEVVTDSASGGETQFRTLNRPVAKAFLLSANQAPFNLVDSSRLGLKIGGVNSVHTFDESEFQSIEAGSAYEVVASINGDPTISFSARTFGGGKFVIVFARAEENEDVELVDVEAPFIDAAPAFLFPASRRFTSLLYRNDRLLSKDGTFAALRSNPFPQWNGFVVSQTLEMEVDFTPTATYTFVSQDFIDALTGFNSVGRNSPEAWAAVINRKVPGVSATVEGEIVVLTSNRGRQSGARLSITGGTLVSNGVFVVGEAIGADRDYILDRATGDITLLNQAGAGDRYTLGSSWTRAFLETVSFAAQNLDFDTSLWFAVDGDTSVIPNGIGTATEMNSDVIDVLPGHLRILVRANGGTPFDRVEPGDWMLTWDPDTDVPDSLRTNYRVLERPEVDRVVLEKRQFAVPRLAHGAVSLQPATGSAGVVLIVGGYAYDGAGQFGLVSGRSGKAVTDSCELMDLDTQTAIQTGKLATARACHTTTLLNSGKVLVVGGFDQTGAALASTEIYDPGTGLWTAGPTLDVARGDHQATLLASGRVLITGGWDGVVPTSALDSSVEYSPGSPGTFINAATMLFARYGHGAVKFDPASAHPNEVLVACGIGDAGTKMSVCEVYDPGAITWILAGGPENERAYMGLSAIGGEPNKIMLAGDREVFLGDESQDTYSIYYINIDGAAQGSFDPFDTQISTVGGTKIQFADKALCQSPDGTVVALGARSTTGGVAKMVHLVWNGTAWIVQADYNFWAREIERTRTATCAVTSDPAGNRVLFHGGSSVASTADSDGSGVACATAGLFDPGADVLWEIPDDSNLLINATLDSRGITFVRTRGGLTKVVLPAGTGYTAPTYVSALNQQLFGAHADVYRTSAMRVSTNSFGTTGDIALVAADNVLPPLPHEIVETNLVPHMASVVTGNSGLGTPDDWMVQPLLWEEPAIGADAAVTAWIAQQGMNSDPVQSNPPSSASMVGLRRWVDGLNPAHWEAGFTPGDDREVTEQGNAVGYWSTISDLTALGSRTGTLDVVTADRVRVGLRTAAQMEYAAHQPFVFARPFATGPSDDVTIILDGDADTKRFVIPMYRKMRPTDAQFDGQIGLADLDGGNLTCNQTFGSAFSFDDFAVNMKARVKTHSATASKRLLWRFWRLGAEGEHYNLRYMYAGAPAATATTRIVYAQDGALYNLGTKRRAAIEVTLGSGALRSAQLITATSKLGLARCNPTAGKVFDTYAILGYSVVQGERTTIHGLTRLRVQVPNNGTVAQGPQSSGINAGDVLWVQMTVGSPITLQSGAFTVDSVGSFNAGTGQQDVFVPADTLHDGTSTWTLAANPATLSFDNTQENIWDPAVIDGDSFRIDGTDLPTPYTGLTMRVASHGRQYLRCRFPNTGAAVTTPVWTTVVNPANLKVFGGPTQTATQLAAAITALQGTNSVVPVSATVTGTGAGVIDRASWDEADIAVQAFDLTDGHNYVQRTIPGGTLLTQTQFLLKDPVSADLATDADWGNEDVRLVAVTTKNIVDWFNAPTVSGMFTAADIRAADAGRRPQVASLTPGTAGSVEVQGGQANLTTAAVFGAAHLDLGGLGATATMRVTVRRSEAAGLVGRAYVRTDNAVPLAKSPFWSSGDSVTGINKLGNWLFDVPPYVLRGTWNDLRVVVERVGPYVAIHIPKMMNPPFIPQPQSSECTAFDYVYLCPATGAQKSDLTPITTPNQGVYRIIQNAESHLGLTLWIENDSAVDGTYVCKMKTLGNTSAVPGDIWQVMTTQFGVTNRRSWTITEVGTSDVGDEMYTTDALRVDTTEITPEVPGVSIPFGAATTQVQLREGVPATAYARVIGIAPNQDDGSYVDVVLDIPEPYVEVSAAAGTVLTALDKLAFPSGVWLGVDGYAYDTGLLHEAGKVVYGDEDDEATYPGYAAHGADIMLSGSLVKRIRLALGLRVESGMASDDLADRVRSAVAAVVNATPVGKPVSIGAIVAAAQSVPGVISASPILPALSSTSDVIPVGAGEKPRILDLRGDISISFVGV